jgi:hypothetical protein
MAATFYLELPKYLMLGRKTMKLYQITRKEGKKMFQGLNV